LNRWEGDQGAAYWEFRRALDDALFSLASRGVTAREIAGQAGIAEATISKWRHGDRPGDRDRVLRVVAEIDRRFAESGVDAPFSGRASSLVNAMFPVASTAPAHPDESVGHADRPRRRDLVWSFPLVFEAAFFLVRWVSHLRGEGPDPVADGGTAALFVILMAVAIFGPLLADRRRYADYLSDWARERGLYSLVPVHMASPPLLPRLVMASLALGITFAVVLPEYRAEFVMIEGAGSPSSVSNPRFRPLFEAGFGMRAMIGFDLILTAVWRLVFWSWTVWAIGVGGRFDVVQGRSDGGWWPPLRAAYVTIVATATAGLLFRTVVTNRSVPLDEQTLVGVVRVLGPLLLLGAMLLLFVLHRAHEHRPADAGEAVQLSLGFIPASLVVLGVIGLLYLD
jgi:transcriptional regulator with XRE-family HTH domain